MIKKLLLFFVFTSLFSHAQVGIGTTAPDPSSMLDIRSANAGLLIPRVNLTSTTDNVTIPNPALSLMVYNLATQNDVIPGFYFWQGGTWRALSQPSISASPTSGWALNGNNLTTGSEFLGSTNYQALLFRVNNTLFSRYHPLGGISIGNNSAANDNQSIAIGTNAKALVGNESIAIGKDAIASNFRTNAIGYDSRASNNNAFALGTSSRASGQQATALGAETTASGQNATAIGYQSTATQANSIILGNSTNNNNRVGIGTNTPDERLHINGSVKIVDGTQAAGRVLTSDANGRASWVDSNTAKSYGELYRNSSTTLTSGAIAFDSTGANSGMTINSSNVQVTVTGLYRVSYTISIKKNSGSSISPEFYLTNYGSEIAGTRTYATVGNGDTRSVSMVKLVNLNAYQAVSVFSSLGDTNTNLISGSNLVVEFIK